MPAPGRVITLLRIIGSRPDWLRIMFLSDQFLDSRCGPFYHPHLPLKAQKHPSCEWRKERPLGRDKTGHYQSRR